MTDSFVVRRRSRKKSPMHDRRITSFAAVGAAAGGGAVVGEFPGSEMPEPEGAGKRVGATALSAILHALLIGALVFAASQVVEEEEETTIDIVMPDELPGEDEPAPSPVSVAEIAANLAPAPMAVAPQIVNPTVIQNFSQPIQQARIDTAVVTPTVAPTEVAVRSVSVENVAQVASPITATTVPRIETYAGPAIKGPIQHSAPVGVVSGPRQVVSRGSTLGTGGPDALGTGSSVSDGIASNRDVFGADVGQRASANTDLRNMDKAGRGTGGTGTGSLSTRECLALPEVQRYMAQIKDRTISRWSLPIGATTTEVTLQFKLDVAGSASGIRFKETGDKAVGESAVDALRAASPFQHMKGKVRCLANTPLIARFKNPTVVSN